MGAAGDGAMGADSIALMRTQRRRRPLPIINVAVGLIRCGRRVLLVQRPAAGPLPHQWEFPGGKIEAGETPEAAVRRELYEEVGLTVGACARLPPLRHDYDHVRVRLHPLAAEAGAPLVRLRGPAAHRWAYPARLSEVPILPGSAALVRRLAFMVQ